MGQQNSNLYLGGGLAAAFMAINDLINTGVLTPEILAMVKGMDLKGYAILALVMILLRRRDERNQETEPTRPEGRE